MLDTAAGSLLGGGERAESYYLERLLSATALRENLEAERFGRDSKCYCDPYFTIVECVRCSNADPDVAETVLRQFVLMTVQISGSQVL